MHLTIATAGHIDHGKSTLVQALTGTHPDRLPEERARGISIELGFAHTTVGDVTLSFVDVPGHERFVRTMLAGVGGIDAVLLVVAADESVMPQTREHFDICRLLDVPAGVIALTRCDLADETMQGVAELDVRALVEGSPLADAPIVRVSATTGAGLDELRLALLQCAQARRVRDAATPARLPIDRVFTVKGFGTVVTGTLWSGRIAPESELTAWPGGQRVRVRGVQVHGAPAPYADAGQRAALNVATLGRTEIDRGHVLLADGVALSTRRLAVDVTVLRGAVGPGAPTLPLALRHGMRLHVHLGTTSVVGRLILPSVDADGSARALSAGARGAAVLRLETPLPARRGDRLVLRSYSPVTTVGGAVVLDPAPPARGVPSAAPAVTDVAALLLARVREAGPLGCARVDLPARCGVAPPDLYGVAQRLTDEGVLAAAGQYWGAVEILDGMQQAMLARLDEAMASNPLSGGVPRAALRKTGGRRWRVEVADLVLARLADAAIITGEDRITRATAQAPGRDPVDVRVLASLDAAALAGMTVADLEATGDAPDRKSLSAVLSRLARGGDVARVGDLYVSHARLMGLVDDLRAASRSGDGTGRVEIGWFKDRYGLTRRAAIPLLEWLDRTRVTRREGDARVVIETR